MNRAYHKWYSTELQRDMEMLVFGDRGAKVIFFPTRRAHFYDYENWEVIEALRSQIESGFLHVFCVDSIDAESFYSTVLMPDERILRHLQYEKYILNEVIPFANNQNHNPSTIVAGCSLGAYHAMNIAFRHPHFFNKVVCMSGRYDLTKTVGSFLDLFYGYMDDNIYSSMPSRYVPNMTDTWQIEAIQRLKVIIAIGQEDAFLSDNLQLNQALYNKHINHEFIVWEGEAHKPEQWKTMVQLYF